SKPIQTNVPGIQIVEHFPLMAQRPDRSALFRSVFHHAAPVHETGHHLMQTGHLFRGGYEYPSYGAVVSRLHGSPSVVVPAPLGNTGVSVNHGQGAGYLGENHEPFVLRGDPNAANYTVQIDRAHRAADTAAGSVEPEERLAFDTLFSARVHQALDIASERTDLRARYGRNTFGQSCLLARRLVESGVRLVTVNMFDTVFNEVTWDCHADG